MKDKRPIFGNIPTCSAILGIEGENLTETEFVFEVFNVSFCEEKARSL
jgi:hypothetical protein